MKKKRDRRGEVSAAEMAAIKLGPGWTDGRFDSLFCRIEAQIDMRRLIRAEVTWADDAERDDYGGVVGNYFDPMITLESNRIDPRDPKHWITVETIHIDLSKDEAVGIVTASADKVFRMFGKEIDSLQLAEGVA